MDEQQMSDDELLDVVRAETGSYQRPKGIDYGLVFPTVARREGDWCYVIVTASKRPPRSADYYDALRDIEHRIDERTGLHVLLVPALSEVV